MYEADEGEFEYDVDGTGKFFEYKTNELTGWKIAGTFLVSELDEAVSPIINKL